MGLPKNMTPALIRKLNQTCKQIREGLPDVCADCIEIGWCAAVWVTVAGDGNDKIVGNLESGGLDDGEKDRQARQVRDARKSAV